MSKNKMEPIAPTYYIIVLDQWHFESVMLNSLKPKKLNWKQPLFQQDFVQNYLIHVSYSIIFKYIVVLRLEGSMKICSVLVQNRKVFMQTMFSWQKSRTAKMLLKKQVNHS